MATARYQGGSITLKKRAKGLDVWEFRWRDDGGKQRGKLLGTTAQYPTEKDAQCAADAFRLEINSELPKAVPITALATQLHLQHLPRSRYEFPDCHHDNAPGEGIYDVRTNCFSLRLVNAVRRAC